jgi:hypothetical protein
MVDVGPISDDCAISRGACAASVCPWSPARNPPVNASDWTIVFLNQDTFDLSEMNKLSRLPKSTT